LVQSVEIKLIQLLHHLQNQTFISIQDIDHAGMACYDAKRSYEEKKKERKMNYTQPVKLERERGLPLDTPHSTPQ
jgi:hypothetical protein